MISSLLLKTKVEVWTIGVVMASAYLKWSSPPCTAVVKMLEAPAFRQTRCQAAAGKRRAASIGGKGDPLDSAVTHGQPELHGVPTGSGNARVAVKVVERSAITGIRGVIARRF